VKRLVVAFAFGMLMLITAVFWRDDRARALRADRAIPTDATHGADATEGLESRREGAPEGSVPGSESASSKPGRADVVVNLIDAESRTPITATQRVYQGASSSETLIASNPGPGWPRFEWETGVQLRLRAEAAVYMPSDWFTVRLKPGELKRTITVPLTRYTERWATLRLRVRTERTSSAGRFQVLWGVVGARSGRKPPGRKVARASDDFHFELDSDRYWFRVSAPSVKLANGSRIRSLWIPEVFELNLAGGEARTHDVVLRQGGRVRLVVPPGLNNWPETPGSMLQVRERITDPAAPRRLNFRIVRGVPVQTRSGWDGPHDGPFIATLAPGEHTIEVIYHDGSGGHRMPIKPLVSRLVSVSAGTDQTIDLTATIRQAIDHKR